MSGIAYIGVDDTDVPGSIGTGRVARGLAECLAALGLGRSLGVTRHQLLVDPRIPYTSHNSSLCVGFQLGAPVSELRGPSVAYLRERFLDGSDPGLCICEAENVRDALVMFGHRATREVLAKEEAVELADGECVYLRELGGTGGGVIGALAAVGLRADGNDGRYVELAGIRDIAGLVSVGEIKACTAIEAVQDTEGTLLGDAEVVDSQDWLRPSLVGGRAVLRVQRAVSDGNGGTWVSVERRAGKGNRDRREQE